MRPATAAIAFEESMARYTSTIRAYTSREALLEGLAGIERCSVEAGWCAGEDRCGGDVQSATHEA